LEKQNSSTENLVKLYGGKYQSRNILLNYLLNKFFNDIKIIISKWDASIKILEVGCGLGESTKRILPMLHGQYLEVSEYESELVDLLKKSNFPVKISQESVYSLKRKNGEFDCVILLEVLEHLDDYRKALSEVFRVANKYVILSVPHEPWWKLENVMRGKYLHAWGNTPGHVNHWNRKTFENLISEFGVVKKVFLPFPWIIIYAEVKK
jgi:2-polyprenyl-3-methyl-5-hydroxy-6-metoxy-1,4-benzoquinol methylase